MHTLLMDIHYGSNEISIAPNNTVVLLNINIIIRHSMSIVIITVIKKPCAQSISYRREGGRDIPIYTNSC